jgi:hypothetical protein
MLKILFLAPHVYTGTMPFAMESIASLADRGHHVDMITSSIASPPITFSNRNIKVFVFKDTETIMRFTYFAFFKKALMSVSHGDYDVVICLSQHALIAGYMINLIFNKPHIFYNDELHFGNESKRLLGKAYGSIIKKFERVANRHVLFTVTQDPLRGQILTKLNNISLNTLRYLPNSRTGAAEIKKSFFLHDKLNLSNDIKIILWPGGTRPGDGAIELARSTKQWPVDYRMVFHFPKRPITDYMKEIIAYNGVGRTLVSTEPIPYEDVDNLMTSASIGLGLYADQGPNVYFMGTASGKINSFLQFGIPCIVNNFEGLRWIEKNGAGICINNASETLSSIQKIFSEYHRYQQQSVDTYNNLLNFEQAFKPIAEELEKLLIKQ